ncbi:MAG: fumarate hydratase [Sedimentisphaerales bacterium]|nr:fumarate hydratase [Sedimentisphaerales bacterium]
MRNIEFSKVVETVESLCIKAAYELPADVLNALQKAVKTESSPLGVKILEQLIENARLAKAKRIPLCQDTGLAVVFVEQGNNVIIDCPAGKTPVDAINEGVSAGYEKGYLRKSVVAEPLKERKNTGSNTPAVIHWSLIAGDKLKITFMAKGGGCENKSAFKMFKPTVAKDEIIDWILEVVKNAGADACPPFIVGVGIGGNFEASCILSKKALLRSIDLPNQDSFYAGLEDDLLSRINRLGIGPQGLGGDTTALAVLIETAPCHIASLPVAVNIECHSHRHCATEV